MSIIQIELKNNIIKMCDFFTGEQDRSVFCINFEKSTLGCPRFFDHLKISDLKPIFKPGQVTPESRAITDSLSDIWKSDEKL